MFFQNILQNLLESNEWKTRTLDIKNVSHENGSNYFELDGAISAYHRAFKYRVIFIIETKQYHYIINNIIVIFIIHYLSLFLLQGSSQKKSIPKIFF